MKSLLVIASLAALGGCAVAPSGPAYYESRAVLPADSQWHVVSVTPVAPGTGARVAASSGSGSPVQYSSGPVSVSQPLYVPQPVYVQPPMYLPQPSYYYPPVSISLDFVFGRHWHGGHRGGAGRAHFGGRRHR